MISIIDYGVGNLNSVYKALQKLGFEVQITNNATDIDNSSALILPGVGAFKNAMENLINTGLIKSIKENVSNGKPILGICLGMQLFYERSFEDGSFEGLGLLEGEIVKFTESVKIPHMGWNNLTIKREDEITKYIKEDEYAYFVHSYFAKSTGKEVIAYAEYGDTLVPGIVNKGNIYGMQFHPEKSGQTGLNLLRAFGEMI